MKEKIIVIGSRPYKTLDLSEIIDEFEYNIRVNLALPGNMNGTKYDRQILNNHLYVNVNDMSTFDEIYKSKCEASYLSNFINNFDKKNYNRIYPQLNDLGEYNRLLQHIGCPYRFRKLPRCGFNAIHNALVEGFDVTIAAFSLFSDSRSFYAICDTSNLHEPETEFEIIRWMHQAGIIDATLCLFEDFHPLTINASGLRQSPHMTERVKKLHGPIVMKFEGFSIVDGLYTNEQLDTMENEFHRLFDEHKDLIEILDKEGCSNDERIFNAQKHSPVLKSLITDNSLLNNHVKSYTGRDPTTDKLLINRLVYEEGKVKNSGAGWHRGNHMCQFKTLVYLSDVSEKTGNFQFMTKSSTKHIGYPTPRTPSYNTRFEDKTVYDITKNNQGCQIINMCGKRGTVILVDTTYIHRGNIIKEGKRFAATQYYF